MFAVSIILLSISSPHKNSEIGESRCSKQANMASGQAGECGGKIPKVGDPMPLSTIMDLNVLKFKLYAANTSLKHHFCNTTRFIECCFWLRI